jgi:hypothetical protein
MPRLFVPSSLLTLLVAFIGLSFSLPARVQLAAAQSTSTSFSLPKVAYGDLGYVGLAGAFQGLQFYDPSSLPLTGSNASGGALLRRDAFGALGVVGRTNDGGRINSVCSSSSSKTVYVGGLFTSIGSTQASNIASYDPDSKSFSALGPGTNGEVLNLYCDDAGSRVLVGGTFSSPGQNVASWPYSSTAAGTTLEFGGLNGAVRAIERRGGSVFFGGDFSVAFAGNGSPAGTPNPAAANSSAVSNFPSIGSALVPVNTINAQVWATPTTYRSGFGLPTYTFCPDGEDGPGSSWLLVNGQQGLFTVNIGHAVSARGVRIGNTFFNGDGTRTFKYVCRRCDFCVHNC